MISLKPRALWLAVSILLATGAAAVGGEGSQTKGENQPSQLLLKSASSHPIKYFLSLPTGHSPGRGPYPVLVCVDSAGSNFQALAERMQMERARLPCLIVCPCTFSNTNAITGYMRAKYRRFYSDALIDMLRDMGDQDLDWDEAGILAIHDDLQREFGAEKRFYITGFSGGGLTAYRIIFRHADKLAGAFIACGNFFPHVMDGPKVRHSPEDLSVPIHLVLGETDHNRASTKASQLFSTPLQEFLLTVGGGLLGCYLVWRTARRRIWVIAVACTSLGVMGLFLAGRMTGLDARQTPRRNGSRRLVSRTSSERLCPAWDMSFVPGKYSIGSVLIGGARTSFDRSHWSSWEIDPPWRQPRRQLPARPGCAEEVGGPSPQVDEAEFHRPDQCDTAARAGGQPQENH
jgi:predicted esterase